MKKISKIFIFSALILSGMWACKKEENRVIFTGGTAPVLTASVSDSIPLSYATRDNEGLQLSWTNPNYQFNTGISSLNVNYNVEIDTAGANFTNPNREVLSLGTDLSRTFTQSAFNDYLLNTLQLQPAIIHNIEVRVTAFLVGGAEPIISNVLKFTATPYAIQPKVEFPPSGQLFITGDATDGGWMVGSGVGVPTPAQQFTKVTPTLYTITVHLNGGKQFLFIPANGDWGNKYACESTSAQPTSGGDFGYNGGNSAFNANFPGPLAGGNYTITVDFQRGKYTITQ
jgi:hypothetical protein